ncbi:MAG: CHASE4 domain-containing protein [Pirellulaceae bacterium]
MLVFPRFLQLERREALRDLERCHQAIQRDLDHLDRFVHDWGAWDDVHAYVIDHDTEFERENFVSSMLEDTHLNLIAVVDLAGRWFIKRLATVAWKTKLSFRSFLEMLGRPAIRC